MQRPYAKQQNHQTDFDTLYRAYWKRVVQFCAKSLASLPEGTAEEIAQDVFMAAYRAMENQCYRGDGAISSWLFGITRNLCCKAQRDTYRHTTSRDIRRLERDIEQMEQEVAHLMYAPTQVMHERVHFIRERLTLARAWLERERQRMQWLMMESAHADPPASLDTPRHAHDPVAAMQ